MLIRAEEGLSRGIVKHLNNIEEQILESRAWTHDSALWKALHGVDNKVPTCEEVCALLLKCVCSVNIDIIHSTVGIIKIIKK